jgi:MoaE-MoaD fusion protein
MNHRVLLFANFRELVGSKHVQVSLAEGSTVKDLKLQLTTDFPVLEKAIGSALISVNRQFAFDEDILPPEAEVAIFPPVSGGSSGEPPAFYEITESVLDIDAVLRQITLPTTGAACVFSGMVRGITSRDDPHQTSYLVYEAYKPMAEEKMRQVAQEIRQRWPRVEGIYMVQRIGRLDPGTPTVLIACSSPHRDHGVFEAARYGIDRLKEIVPVWKKEFGSNGEEWVEGEYTPGRSD